MVIRGSALQFGKGGQHPGKGIRLAGISSMAMPCSVNANGNFRRPPSPDFQRSSLKSQIVTSSLKEHFLIPDDVDFGKHMLFYR